MTPKVKHFLVELGATIFTLAGMWVGSTTLPGALLYGISLFFWFYIGWAKQLWGIMPLNILTTVVVIRNILINL
jgi:hypothetical protein